MLNISEKFCFLAKYLFAYRDFLIWIPKYLYSIYFFAALAGSQVVNKNEPMFISRSEAFKFAVGDVITLPCEVTHPGKIFSFLAFFYEKS